MKRKKIKRKIEEFVADVSFENWYDMKGSTVLGEGGLDLDNEDFKELRDKINEEFDLELKKKELKSCLDIRELVDLIEGELDDEISPSTKPALYIKPNSNIIKDIVADYQNCIKKGINDVYYKKDLIGGVKLILTIIGIGKIALVIGGTAAAAIGSIMGYAANHPQTVTQCAAIISKNSDEIEELITSASKKFNESYNDLSDKEKKRIRTVILFVAKNGIDWDDLH